MELADAKSLISKHLSYLHLAGIQTPKSLQEALHEPDVSVCYTTPDMRTVLMSPNPIAEVLLSFEIAVRQLVEYFALINNLSDDQVALAYNEYLECRLTRSEAELLIKAFSNPVESSSLEYTAENLLSIAQCA
jgi:hypothetical protein